MKFILESKIHDHCILKQEQHHLNTTTYAINTNISTEVRIITTGTGNTREHISQLVTHSTG
jgi:hypothetical protein